MNLNDSPNSNTLLWTKNKNRKPITDQKFPHLTHQNNQNKQKHQPEIEATTDFEGKTREYLFLKKTLTYIKQKSQILALSSCCYSVKSLGKITGFYKQLETIEEEIVTMSLKSSHSVISCQ